MRSDHHPLFYHGLQSPRSRALLAAFALVPFLLTATPSESAGQTRNLSDAVYSPEQAKTGRKLFRKHCQSCHEEEYFTTVMAVWNGEALSELFSVTAAIMPQNNPGSLRDQEYLDIFAYIMSANGYPAGDEPLGASDIGDITVQPLD